MDKLRFHILTLLLAGLLLVGLLMLYQLSCAPGVGPLPTVDSAALLPLATETAPPTWTPSPTLTPSPTWTSLPTRTPTTTPSPPPTATPTETPTPQPLPPTVPAAPWRPTLAPIVVTVTPHPSSTLEIPPPVPRLPLREDAITVLLLGSDQRPDWNDWHTDAIQYVIIYPDVPSVTMVSIPRDLYVYIPNFWMSRINFADMYGEVHGVEGGGFGLLNQTLLYNLGITADYYVKVDFQGLIGLVNALGGVDVPVHCRLEDYWPYPTDEGEYLWKVMQPGVHHMDGREALWYSRSRKTTSVFSRDARQQQILEAMWRKGREANLLEMAPTLYEQWNYLFETDMGVANVLSLALVGMRLQAADVNRYSIGWSHITPHVTPYGGNVFLPEWERIEPLLQRALAKPSSSRAAQSLVPVEVWNGTPHQDWDLLVADKLAHHGYLPLIGQPDRRDYARTQIIFYGSTTKGSGLSYLQGLFGVSEADTLYQEDPGRDPKLRLIIGADYNTCW